MGWWRTARRIMASSVSAMGSPRVTMGIRIATAVEDFWLVWIEPTART
jgi:hypothetical protein